MTLYVCNFLSIITVQKTMRAFQYPEGSIVLPPSEQPPKIITTLTLITIHLSLQLFFPNHFWCIATQLSSVNLILIQPPYCADINYRVVVLFFYFCGVFGTFYVDSQIICP